MKHKHLMIQHILIFLVLSTLALSGCPFYRIFGLPCPCCGTTRAWLAFFRGEISLAFQYNAFFLLIPGMLFCFAHRTNLLKKWKTPLNWLLAILAALLFGYHLLRWLHVIPMPDC